MYSFTFYSFQFLVPSVGWAIKLMCCHIRQVTKYREADQEQQSRLKLFLDKAIQNSDYQRKFE